MSSDTPVGSIVLTKITLEGEHAVALQLEQPPRAAKDALAMSITGMVVTRRRGRHGSSTVFDQFISMQD